MKTKTIFKALALAMMMPAMMLTTACSSDDDTIINNENINKKSYEIPVTLNATRQGDDATTRATYNPDTRKIEYSTGDQLYVFGNHETAGMYGGALEWKGGIIFSGTITTTNPYSGTGVELLSSAIWARAMLLPAGYNKYNYLMINNPFISYNYGNSFANSKTTAIEQFSNETVLGYSNGFALVPQNAILNFTINGLTPNTEFAVELWNSYYGLIEGNVTTNGSGTATFAIGIDISVCTQYDIANLYGKGWDLRMKDNNNDYVLRMYDDNNPLVTSSKPLVAGKIYNITRSVASTPAARALSEATTDDIGKIVGDDGNIYDNLSALTAGVTAAAMIGYVGSGTGFTHGLAIALTEEGTLARETAISTAAAHTPTVSGGTWRLLTDMDIQYILKGCGCCNANPSHFTEDGEYFSWTFDLSKLQNKLTAVGGTTFGTSGSNRYWVDYMAYGNYSYFYLGDTGYTYSITSDSSNTYRARAVLAF